MDLYVLAHPDADAIHKLLAGISLVFSTVLPIAPNYGALKRAARGLGALSQAGKYGIQPYNQLTKALKGTGLQAHHLVEQRFAGVLGQNARQMASVAVTKAEHQAFTNAWRQAIPYGQGTANATRQQ